MVSRRQEHVPFLNVTISGWEVEKRSRSVDFHKYSMLRNEGVGNWNGDCKLAVEEEKLGREGNPV